MAACLGLAAAVAAQHGGHATPEPPKRWHEVAVVSKVDPDHLLATAEGTGLWLEQRARCAGGECSWKMNSTDAAPLTHAYLNQSLYYGPIGVALFLNQLDNATANQQPWGALALKASMSTAAYVERGQAIADYGSNVGLYYGLAGLAFGMRSAALQLHSGGQKNRLMQAAASLEAHILQVPPFAAGSTANPLWNNTDVAHGVSGTGLYLLWASQRFPDSGSTLLRAAVRAGQWLINQAEVPPFGDGLRWRRGPDTDGSHANEYFPTFCCGTAGVGYFLSELSRAVAPAQRLPYQAAAIGAARHVLAVANASSTKLIVEHGEQGTDRDIYYAGWCGGGAGWSRLFASLYMTTANREWLGHITTAAAAIERDALPSLAMYVPTPPGKMPWRNLGQCCGLAAVGTFFLQVGISTFPIANATKIVCLRLARQIGTILVRSSIATADGGITFASPEEHTDPTTTRWQAGWMQGNAGIASFLLHLQSVIVGTPNGRRTQWPDEPWNTFSKIVE